MSDTSQGEGWWLASDGKWYPPQPAASGLSGVTCTITVDGEVINTNTANGPGATASCSS